MIRALLALAAAASLSACVSGPKLDVCKYASVRRAVYTTTIRAADLYPPPVPYEVTLGRTAAVTALSVLDANCPKAITP